GSTGNQFVGVRLVTDAERAPKPVMSVRECFAHSSNVGMSKLAWQTFANQPDKFLSYLHRYHFDSRTGIDLIGEENPVLPKIRRNKEGMHAMVTMSFGYAIEVTPLQTLMLYNAIANDGKMMKPYLVNRIQSNGQTVKEFEPEVLEEKIAGEDVIKAARSCMYAVTTEGTGKKVFANALYTSGGKTGTAHVAGTGVNYDDGIYQASYAGFFPFDKPKYSCIVVIRTKAHPVVHMGGEVSAPVFREIADKLYALEASPAPMQTADLKKDSSLFYYAGQTDAVRQVMNKLNLGFTDSAGTQKWGSIYGNKGTKPVVSARVMAQRTMPDVKGMGLKDALYLLESMKLKVITRGKGKVTSQSIEAGRPTEKGTTVIIELS
ncbi:MAG: PASTA domain-containing protein, partial [Bacteroidetes bacterium]|nr:PASTA domain-containing protein [Bacteroidota bacterium]